MEFLIESVRGIGERREGERSEGRIEMELVGGGRGEGKIGRH